MSLLQVPTSPLLMRPVRPSFQERVWDGTSWRPHPLQREILLNQTRHQVLAAGRRMGKSQIGGHKLVPEVFRAMGELDLLKSLGHRREFWIIGPEYSDSEKEFRVIWNAIDGLGFNMDHPGSYNNSEAGQMRISMFDGRLIIHAKSAKYPGTLVGEGLSGVVFSEAAKLKPSVWIKYIRPTLADFEGWAFFGSTPEGRNWFYDLWAIGQDPKRPDWASWRAPAWMNPYVYGEGVNEALLKEAIEARRQGKLDGLIEVWQMIKRWDPTLYQPIGIHREIWSLFLDMSQEMFNQEIAALFTEYVGRVFKDFDEELHVTDQEFREDWHTYACADYGFQNPFVWLLIQVDPHNERVHILNEYYETGKTTEEAGAEIQRRGLAPSVVRRFFPDPAEPDRTLTLERQLRIAGFKGGSIPKEDRIEWIRRKLKMTPEHLPFGHPEKAPGLTIHRRCINTIREMNIWRYPETPEQASERGRSAPEEPMKKDDHTPEALGRFFSGHYGSPWREASVRQTKAKTRR